MPPFLTESYNHSQLLLNKENDTLLTKLLDSMSKRPSHGKRKTWMLNFIPPKNLRLPEYTYTNAEESPLCALLNVA